MAKHDTKCGVNLIKCGDLSVNESHFDNLLKSYSSSKALVMFEYKETSGRTNDCTLQVCNFSEFNEDIIVKEEEEDNVEDELHPITFVAVSPVSPKIEELNDLQCVPCAHDPLMPNPLREDRLNGDETNRINVREEGALFSDWEEKLEVKEDMLVEENNCPLYSEDCFAQDPGEVEVQFEAVCDLSMSDLKEEKPENPGEVEVQFEAVCDISTSDLKEEKPVDTRLYNGSFDGAKKKPLQSKGRSAVLTIGAKESSIIGYQNERNKELDVEINVSFNDIIFGK